jgi:FG-GAP-like repeat
MKPNRFTGPTRGRRPTRRTSPASRPCLEVLEDRCLLSFSPAVSYAAGASPLAVVTADFNHDGRLDLATANAGDNTVSVLLGNGDGTFQPAQPSATGATPASVAVGDFNTDGKLDLATANQGGSDVSVLLGHGDGTFQAPNNLDLGSTPASVAVGDFNADGKLDLGVTSNVYYPGSPGYWVCYHGWYGDYCTYYPGSPGYYEGRANVLLGHGDGSFSVPSTTGLGEGYHTSAAVADFNGDGRPDFAAANYDYATVGVLAGDGLGNLQAPTDFATDYAPWSVAAADLDGDGDADLVTANLFANTVGVLAGDGLGSFGPAQSYAAGPLPQSVAVADFNRDGWTDLVTANADPGSVSVLRGNGDGTFQAARDYAAGSSPASVAAGDFNGDLFPDVATADAGSNDVAVLLNTQDWRSFAVSGFPSPATAGTAHTLTVAARDTAGGLLANYAGTVHFTSSDPQADLPADYTFTAADHGTHTFTVTLKTAGPQGITVTDTAVPDLSGSQTGVVVNPAAASRFDLAGFPSTTTSGDAGSFRVTAYDAYGNQATGYAGTVHFTSSDGQATLPADYTFTASDAGTASFLASLVTVGRQSLTAADTAHPSVTRTQTGIRVVPRTSVSGPPVAARNQVLPFTLGAGGLSPGSVFAFAIDWNGDGTTDQTVSGPSGTTVPHSYSTGGSYAVGVTATVRLGGEDYTSPAASTSVNVLALSAATQADPGDASRSALVVEGTASGETVVLSPGAGNGVAVTYNGTPLGTITAPGGAPFAHVLVYGYGGGDTVRLTGGLAVPALLFGGDDNDTLDAGGSGANNVLVGGNGNDAL